jgi:hypothetical protein
MKTPKVSASQVAPIPLPRSPKKRTLKKGCGGQVYSFRLKKNCNICGESFVAMQSHQLFCRRCKEHNQDLLDVSVDDDQGLCHGFPSKYLYLSVPAY